MKNSFPNTIQQKQENILNIDKKIEEIHKDLQEFFGIELTKQPKITFVNSREEMDSFLGKKTEDWCIAYANKEGIFITAYDKFEEVSKGIHSKEKFFSTLKHEFSHIYYYEKTNTESPAWLNEGLAYCLANQKNTKPSNEELLAVFDFFNNDEDSPRVYKIGYFWTKYLIETFGKEKLLELLNKIGGNKLTKDIFKDIFYKVYGFEYSKESFEKILN